eukprot:gene27634-7272_t
MADGVIEQVPVYSLNCFDDGKAEKLSLNVQLPGVESASELDVIVSTNRIQIHVPGRYKLDLALEQLIEEKPVFLRFVKKTQALKFISLPASQGQKSGGAKGPDPLSADKAGGSSTKSARPPVHNSFYETANGSSKKQQQQQKQQQGDKDQTEQQDKPFSTRSSNPVVESTEADKIEPAAAAPSKPTPAARPPVHNSFFDDVQLPSSKMQQGKGPNKQQGASKGTSGTSSAPSTTDAGSSAATKKQSQDAEAGTTGSSQQQEKPSGEEEVPSQTESSKREASDAASKEQSQRDAEHLYENAKVQANKEAADECSKRAALLVQIGEVERAIKLLVKANQLCPGKYSGQLIAAQRKLAEQQAKAGTQGGQEPASGAQEADGPSASGNAPEEEGASPTAGKHGSGGGASHGGAKSQQGKSKSHPTDYANHGSGKFNKHAHKQQQRQPPGPKAGTGGGAQGATPPPQPSPQPPPQAAPEQADANDQSTEPQAPEPPPWLLLQVDIFFTWLLDCVEGYSRPVTFFVSLLFFFFTFSINVSIAVLHSLAALLPMLIAFTRSMPAAEWLVRQGRQYFLIKCLTAAPGTALVVLLLRFIWWSLSFLYSIAKGPIDAVVLCIRNLVWYKAIPGMFVILLLWVLSAVKIETTGGGRGGDNGSYGQAEGEEEAGSSWWASGPAKVKLKNEAPKGATGEVARVLRSQNYYEVLDVLPEADDDTIRKAKRTLSLATHPDKAGADAVGAKEAFQRVTAAFEVLSDETKRKHYDMDLNAAKAPRGHAANDANAYVPPEASASAGFGGHSQKMSMPCRACKAEHIAIATTIPAAQARYCSQCDTYHAAKNGESWIASQGGLFSSKKAYVCVAQVEANSCKAPFKFTTDSTPQGGPKGSKSKSAKKSGRRK